MDQDDRVTNATQAAQDVAASLQAQADQQDAWAEHMAHTVSVFYHRLRLDGIGHRQAQELAHCFMEQVVSAGIMSETDEDHD